MRGLASRLQKELESIRKVEEFADFAARRADAIRLTPPRPMQVEDTAEEVLDTLVQRLVASKAAQRKDAKGKAFRQQLGREFENAGLANLVQRDVEVSAPLLPAKFEAPFAFQNGKLNLIAPRDFTGSSEKKIFDQVSVLAVQGGVLADYHDPRMGDLGLIVVGRFGEAHKQDVKKRRALPSTLTASPAATSHRTTQTEVTRPIPTLPATLSPPAASSPATSGPHSSSASISAS